MPAANNACLISTHTQTSAFEDEKTASDYNSSDEEQTEVVGRKFPFDSASRRFDQNAYEETAFAADVKAAALSRVEKTSDVCSFESLPDAAKHEKFFRSAFEVLLKDGVFQATNRANKVNEWVNPEELEKVLELGVNPGPSSHEKLLDLMKTVIKYSVKTGHPYFVNQLFSR